MRVLLCIIIAMPLLLACGANNDLERWHTVDLEQEYRRDYAEDTATFADYLALEERLFNELDQKVYQHTETGPEQTLNRYSAGSAADPRQWDTDWNRSFELLPAQPRGAVLLLHGMSDSPYSLRALGEALYERGYQVLGLRLPGHGTIPSGLKSVQWEDMAASVELAMRHLLDQQHSRPVHVIGYSTGAPLALNYALNAQLSGAEPASLILISPAIGVSPAAALATWKRRLALLPGLGRLAWLSIDPEFDPYKYNSFATNAAEQVYRLTRVVSRRLATLRDDAAEHSLPPILVLKSTVDATVSNSAVVDRLLKQLPPNGHELVLFDLNRSAIASPLLIDDPGPFTNRLLKEKLPFALTLVGNQSFDNNNTVARHRAPHSLEFSSTDHLQKSWPRGVVSLSHVALPFPVDDPLYGRYPPAEKNQLFLGQIPLQGERGVLKISSDWLLRLRHNPFYDYLQQRVVGWIARAETKSARPPKSELE